MKNYFFRSDFSIFDACAKLNSENQFPCQNLLCNQLSLRNLMESNESELNFIREAELKTYPTDKFTSRFLSVLCWIFKSEICRCNSSLRDRSKAIISTLDSSLLEFKQILVEPSYDYIEGDIAGLIFYRVTFEDCSSEKRVKSLSEMNSVFSENLQSLIWDAYTFGYSYIQHCFSTSNGRVVLDIGFEAKFHESEFKVNHMLWHIAPASLKDKILKFGLVPKSKSSNSGMKLEHPDRVYLFNIYDRRIFAGFVRLHDKNSKVFDKETNTLFKTNEFVVFEINTAKLEGIHFYRDDMFQSTDTKNPTAVFTYNNIPPQAISFKEKLARSKSI